MKPDERENADYCIKWHTDGIGQNINQQNEWFVVKFVKFQIAAHLLN